MENSQASTVQTLLIEKESLERLPWLCRVMRNSSTSSSTKNITAEAEQRIIGEHC